MIGAIRLNGPWGEIQPFNRPEFGFSSSFTNGRNSTNNLVPDAIILAGRDNKMREEWIEANTRFQNIPVSIISDTILNRPYFLDLYGITYSDTQSTVAIKPYKGDSHFWSEADNLSFDAIEMFAPMGSKLSNFTRKCPYLVEREDVGIQTLFLAFTIYSLITEIARTVKAIADLAGQAADFLGTGVATTIIQGVALFVYLISMVIALVNFMKELVRLYFPKLRYLNAISDHDLIRLGCRYLGYELKSDLLLSQKELHTMGVPITRNNDRKSFFEFVSDDLSGEVFNYGWPTANDANGKLGAFIDEYMNTWNAQAYVYDGVVRIETREAFRTSPVATIPEVYNDQARKEMRNNYDTSSDWKVKIMGWTVDYTDTHTADNFYKTQTEYQTQLTTSLDPMLVKIQGTRDIIFNYSLAQRKNKLNAIEKLVSTVLGIADRVARIFRASTNYQSFVTARIGAMIISQETFGINKKLWLNFDQYGYGRQPANFIDFIGTDAIYEYHKDLEVSVNSGTMVTDMTFPCTEYTFNQFARNKYVNLGNTGRVVELFDATFNYRSCTATVTYKDFDGSGSGTVAVKIY